MSAAPRSTSATNTGVEGLDDVLCGGFSPNRLHLIEGVPGTGKTTLAMQFMLEGVRLGEKVLYVTLSETAEELRAVADSHGWSLDGMHILEMLPAENVLRPDEQYTVFHPAEIELTEATKSILAEVERVEPTRIVFDSLSEIRLLAGTTLRFRRQILALKQYFIGRCCTVLLLDDRSSEEHDVQVHSIAHAVIVLDLSHPDYGTERRRLRVTKYRGVHYRGGYHDYAIRRGGLQVFPRLVAAEHHRQFDAQRFPSGIAELDALMGGGIDRGTSTLVVGSPGTGKSTLAAQFAAAAAARGQNAILFLFDESANTLMTRTASIGIDLEKYVKSGRVQVQQIDPAELSAGEFAVSIRGAVEVGNASIVVIDSLNGYLNAMPSERFLIIHLHELLMFLNRRGVATILVGAHQGIVGGPMAAPVDASYLADAIVLLRYFEVRGEVRQAISIIKKRGGQHERTIREFRLETGGIRVGEPLREFRGVLTGLPTYAGATDSMLDRKL